MTLRRRRVFESESDDKDDKRDSIVGHRQVEDSNAKTKSNRNGYLSSALKHLDVIEDEVLHHLSETYRDVKDELTFWTDVLTMPVYEDPAMEQWIKAFIEFDEFIQDICDAIRYYIHGAEQLCTGMEKISQTMRKTLSYSSLMKTHEEEGSYIRSMVTRYSESVNNMIVQDSPCSSISRMKNNMKLNVLDPLKKHILLGRKLKNQMSFRRRMMPEYFVAKKEYNSFLERGLNEDDSRFVAVKHAYNEARKRFGKIDRYIYCWIRILNDFRVDIWDTVTQTLKHVQKEFYQDLGTTVNVILPTETLFRPMCEMTPQNLLLLVEDKEQNLMDAELTDQKPAVEAIKTATERMIDEMVIEICPKDKPMQVCPLSLAALMSQGIEEGLAKKALRKNRNDVQEALECIILGDCDGVEEQEDLQAINQSREPKSVKWASKQRELLEVRRLRVGENGVPVDEKEPETHNQNTQKRSNQYSDEPVDINKSTDIADTTKAEKYPSSVYGRSLSIEDPKGPLTAGSVGYDESNSGVRHALPTDKYGELLTEGEFEYVPNLWKNISMSESEDPI